MSESRQAGIFNASGAEDGLTMAGLLRACTQVSGSDARIVWADEEFLLEQRVAPWNDLPLWLPAVENGIFEARNDRAIAAGLTFRPLAVTARLTLEWDRTRSLDEPLAAGLSMERERQLLALYGATDSAH